MQGAQRSALAARQQHRAWLGHETRSAWTVHGERDGASRYELAAHLEQSRHGAARTRAAHGMVAKLFDHARDQLAIEAAADQNGDIAVAIAVAGGEEALVPEGVNGPRHKFRTAVFNRGRILQG